MIMLARISMATFVAVWACAPGIARAGGGPGAVYNDYARDGVLSCNHSRADLVAVLRSGSLNQYGDPLTLAGLKLAVRKQLAGGCPRGDGARQNGTDSAGTPSGGSGQAAGAGQSKRSGGQRGSKPKPASSLSATPNQGSTGGDSASFVAGRGLFAALLVAAVAFGGWLTKRALAARD
jgi:hypothetical protein